VAHQLRKRENKGRRIGEMAVCLSIVLAQQAIAATYKPSQGCAAPIGRLPRKLFIDIAHARIDPENP